MSEVQLFQPPQSPAYQALPGSARIWIYQSDRPFSESELPGLKESLARFAETWVSHSRQLRAFGDVLFDRFILLMVDESLAGASGCSIDKSIYFLHQLEKTFGVNLFDRLNFAWLDGEEVRTAHRDEFAELFEKGEITNETLVFDHLVSTKSDFEKSWLKPLAQSWHKRMVL